MPGPQVHPPPTRSPLTIDSRYDADTVTLVLRGEIDLASAPALERKLEDAESLLPRRIVLDLAGLDFIDSAGIHLLIDAQQRAQADGRQLILTHVPAHATRLFRLTGINERLVVE